ncbi:MAG TPA: nitroreductase family protein [Candidatus Lokiarchaeia archaeon]|nr:nitroreductase family protein [Candidatus Lokiarchaeia archaeon]
MEFSKPIFDIIKERTSRRTYGKTPLAGDLKEKMLGLLAEPAESPFGAECEFRWITLEGLEASQKKKLGTYGFITGARDFIAGTVKKVEALAGEHLGYVLENIILHATDLGLGTCWLAGSFNKSGFAEQAKLGADERMPAITPIGVFKNRRPVEGVIRLVVKANHRKPWNVLFFDNDFTTSLSSENTGELSDAFEGVRLGPSASNGQPWRIIRSDNGEAIHLYAAGGMDLDRGIAVCHFDLIVKERGIAGSWAIKDPGIATPEGMKYVISWHRN